MFMRLAHNSNSLLKLLSATVVTTLFLCLVIGAFCPMVVLNVEASTIFVDSHAGHLSGEDRMCQDSLVSAEESGIRLSTSPFLATLALPSVSFLSVREELVWVAPGSTTLLFRLLSTFRI